MTSRAVCHVADVDEGVPFPAEIDGAPVVVIRVGGRVFVLDALCTHQDVSLVEGEVDTDECLLECPKHGAAFRLDDGTPVSLPATRALRVWPATIDGDQVRVGDPLGER